MDILQTDEGDRAKERISRQLQNFLIKNVRKGKTSVYEVEAGDSVYMYATLENVPLDGLEIHIHSTAKTSSNPLNLELINPVTLSFWVGSYEAAQKVQGLLHLMGEASMKHLDGDKRNKIRILQKQEILRKRRRKPDVKIHLVGALKWKHVPSAFQKTPAASLTSPEAMQTLAKAFRHLEIGPGDSPLTVDEEQLEHGRSNRVWNLASAVVPAHHMVRNSIHDVERRTI